MATTTEVSLTSSYQLVVADTVTAYVIQCHYGFAELIFASSAPDNTDKGILIRRFEGITDSFGAGVDIYAKSADGGAATIVINS